MKFVKHSNRIALWYIISSIFIGPQLFVVVSSFSPGPIGDCYDDLWLKASGSPSLLQRAAIIHHYMLITQIGEGIMLSAGLIILILLIKRNQYDKQVPILLVFGVLFMIAGYGFAIWFLGILRPPCSVFNQ